MNNPFFIWIIILWSVGCYVNHLSYYRHLLKLRQSRCQHKWWRLDPKSRNKVITAFPLTLWSRLSSFCVSLVGSHIWGCLTPPTKGYLPLVWIYCLERAEPFWLRIYNWSTAWPIIILEKNTSLWIYSYTGLNSLNCLWLKLIIVRITFRKRSPRLNTISSQFITTGCGSITSFFQKLIKHIVWIRNFLFVFQNVGTYIKFCFN